MEILMVTLALAGLIATLQVNQSGPTSFGAKAVEECETQGGTCYPSSWTCSGGTLRSWPGCGTGYQCYEGGSCQAPTATPTPSGPNYTCVTNGNYCIPSAEFCDPGDDAGVGGTCQTGQICCLDNAAPINTPEPTATNTPTPTPTPLPTPDCTIPGRKWLEP